MEVFAELSAGKLDPCSPSNENHFRNNCQLGNYPIHKIVLINTPSLSTQTFSWLHTLAVA